MINKDMGISESDMSIINDLKKETEDILQNIKFDLDEEREMDNYIDTAKESLMELPYEKLEKLALIGTISEVVDEIIDKQGFIDVSTHRSRFYDIDTVYNSVDPGYEEVDEVIMDIIMEYLEENFKSFSKSTEYGDNSFDKIYYPKSLEFNSWDEINKHFSIFDKI